MIGIRAAAAAAIAVALIAADHAAARPLELHRVATFGHPVYATQAPGQPRALYVVEQSGRVMVARNGTRLEQPFIDIRDRVRFGPDESRSVEAGMYSVAFDPDYARSRRFYVFYTGRDGDNYVDSFRRSPDSPFETLPGSRRRVIEIPHPYDDEHNGGQLEFGPDGRLWLSSGDGGCCGDPHHTPQNLDDLRGKLLRIAPRPRGGYRAPRSNPLVGIPGHDAVWSYGLRNPWRFSFDRWTGTLALSDVGDNDLAQEEVNLLPIAAARGANFGWPVYEGNHHRDPTTQLDPPPMPPTHTYGHETGGCAITGGYVARDAGLPRLWGRYLFADFCLGRIHSFVAVDGTASEIRDEGIGVKFLSSFGEGVNGRIYVVSRAGPVFRLRLAPPR